MSDVLVSGTNVWCGPTVLAAVSGKTTNECAMLASRNGREQHRMYTEDIAVALDRLRIKWRGAIYCHDYKVTKYPPLAHWMDHFRSPSERRGYVIVLVTGHYVLAHQNSVLCAKTHAKFVPLEKHPYRRAHVKAAWYLKETPNESALSKFCRDNGLENPA